MVVITQKRFKGQDGKPTHQKLLKALVEGTPLEEIPHQFFFPKEVLKNLITIKKTVLRYREEYIASGGGNKMTSVVCIVEGMSGSGKSTIASQVGLFWDPKMTLEINYAWNIKRLMELAENTYPGMVILMDEAMIVNSRTPNSQENLKLIITLSQIRSKGVFFIFCINSVHQLEKTIPLSRADFLIRVKRVGGLAGIPKYCIYDKDKMRQLIVKNSGKYSYTGVFPNIGWTTFSRYFPFDDVRYDKMKHKESKKNLEPKNKEDQKKKYQLALVRLIEYCRMNELIRTYEDFHKITDIPTLSLGTLKNTFYQELSLVNFEKLSALIEEKKKETEDKKYCRCGEVLNIKTKTGLCRNCYLLEVTKDKTKIEIDKEEHKELIKIKEKYDKIQFKKEEKKLKRLEKVSLNQDKIE